MSTPIEKLYSIRLGVQGENATAPVEIDMTSWVEAYPDANMHILFKRYNETTPYPVVSEFDGTILSWIPTLADTAVVGVGYAEIRAIDTNTGLVKKSRIVPTSVEKSVSGLDSDYIPEPFEDWANKVLAARDETAGMAAFVTAVTGGALFYFNIDNEGDLIMYATTDFPYEFEINAEGDLIFYV